MSKRTFYPVSQSPGGVWSQGYSQDVSVSSKRSRPNMRFPMRKTYVPRPKASKRLLKTIKAVVSREEEHKESVQFSTLTQFPPVNNAGWTGSSTSIAPSNTGIVIPQGTGQGNRIGNQIRTRKAVVKGIIHPYPYDPSSNVQPMPTQVRMLIFKDKFNKAGQPASVALDLFQQGSTNLPPQNDLVDMILEVNKDRYTVYHDQVFKIGTAAYTGTGALPTFQNFENNDFTLNAQFEIDVTKFLPSVVKYNDSTASPMSDGLWMIFLPVQSSGGAFGSAQIATGMSWTMVYHYTDA